MANSTAGIAVIGDYVTPGTDALKVAALLALIPDPDNSSSSGAVAVSAAQGQTNSYLDEMSPACAIQLRVELTKLQAQVAQV
jgi:hypothetical protein